MLIPVERIELIGLHSYYLDSHSLKFRREQPGIFEENEGQLLGQPQCPVIVSIRGAWRPCAASRCLLSDVSSGSSEFGS